MTVSVFVLFKNPNYRTINNVASWS